MELAPPLLYTYLVEGEQVALRHPVQYIPLSIRNLHAKFLESINTDAPCCNNDMMKFVSVSDLDTLIFPVLIPSTGPNKYMPNRP